MGHIAIPHGWKEFTFHRGCSYNANSILETRLVAGGRECKEGRQTIFFTPLNPYGEIPDEDASTDDPSVTRMVHYHSNWKCTQDAISCVKLSRAQDQGLRFWETKSKAIIAQIFVCVVTRSTTAEFQHNDMMMRTNVQNDLRHKMALEMWIVSVHEKSEQL